ncbi:WRC-like protein [Cynara cardunculus var. scolymus]|uniref:Growth-regulating factor n=1 Tax=Cynara cardunculus var. scolymus TaxID=59895 RepID=A0A103YL73_CYNCS|nr:WRC-like protein [Cynara cardunculus var. scolymus]
MATQQSRYSSYCCCCLVERGCKNAARAAVRRNAGEETTRRLLFSVWQSGRAVKGSTALLFDGVAAAALKVRSTLAVCCFALNTAAARTGWKNSTTGLLSAGCFEMHVAVLVLTAAGYWIQGSEGQGNSAGYLQMSLLFDGEERRPGGSACYPLLCSICCLLGGWWLLFVLGGEVKKQTQQHLLLGSGRRLDVAGDRVGTAADHFHPDEVFTPSSSISFLLTLNEGVFSFFFFPGADSLLAPSKTTQSSFQARRGRQGLKVQREIFHVVSQLRYSTKKDLELDRCKTDDKKWRCSRDVAPKQKYCDCHLHRGRPRSRKHVELSKNHSPSSSLLPNKTPSLHSNPCKVVGSTILPSTTQPSLFS